MTETMPKICVMITGGTALFAGEGKIILVAKEDDLKPWVAAVPEARLMGAHVDFRVFFGSTPGISSPDVWQRTARFIFEHSKEYAGFIILAGLESIPYFAQALTLMLPHVSLPVVFAGSQLPDYIQDDPTGGADIISRSRDLGVRANLVNALHVVLHDIYGIYVMFGDRLITPERISLTAPLQSIPFNYKPSQIVGNVEFSIKLTNEFEKKLHRKKSAMELKDAVEPCVGVFDLSPVQMAMDIAAHLKRVYGALFYVPPTFAVPDDVLHAVLHRSPRVPVAFVGHPLIVPHEEREGNFFKQLRRNHVIWLEEENKEWLLVKFMWALGQTQDFTKLAAFMIHGKGL